MTDTSERSESSRFMRSDGSVALRRVGLSRPMLRDLYHWLRTTSWPRTFLTISTAWLGSNVLFALLFLAGGECISNARPGHFGDAFFFSVQTLSTIGYGAMSPATDYANVVVVVEAFYGLLFVAITTGILFAKFSTPTARLMFSTDALIADSGGKRMLSFRVANARTSHIVEATIRVSIARDEYDSEGRLMRRLYDLALVRATSPLLALTWTVMHEIDESSPLNGLTEKELEEQRVVLLVTVRGTEDKLSTTVHARHAYLTHHILFDRRHLDVLRMSPDGERYVDYRVFHDHEAA
jgi:inward rectifier potassium channel